MPENVAHYLDQDYHSIKAFEDMGMYYSKVRAINIERINDQAIQMNLCIPNYEEE